MNTLLRSLAAVCRERPFAEKWLLAPSRRAGYQWLDRLALDGTPVLNVRVRTLKFTAFDLAFPLLAERGLSTLSENMALFLIDTVFARSAGRGQGYLLGQAPEAGLFRKIYGALSDLRLAGLGPDSLARGGFEAPAKAAELTLLLQGWLDELERRGLTDYAGTLGLATDRLRRDPQALEGDALVLLPGEPELSLLERRFLDSFPASRLIRLETDSPLNGASFDPLVLERIIPGPEEDGGPRLSAEIFRAVGEPNEVREVFRRILASGWRLDQVEVLHTDSAVYVPLFYELGRALPERDWNSPLGLPVTFAEGLPVSLSRPGRALAAWLEWIEQGYPQAGLVAMLQDGLLKVRGAEDSFGELAAVLRLAPIGLGRARYLPGLDNWIASQVNRNPAPDAEEEEGSAPGDSLPRQVRLARSLRHFVASLIELSPESASAGVEFLERAKKFLAELARTSDKLDNYAREALVERIEELRDWLGEDTRNGELDLHAWLAGLTGSLPVAGSGPAPGCLHLADLGSSGHSGRPVTFVLGLDDSRFPGAGLQDPVLLDAERVRLSHGLPTAASRQSRAVADFVDRLAGLRGRLCLGFSCRSLTDNREMFPSPLLLHLYRRLSGENTADQGRMLERLPAAVSFAPLESGACLDSTEWWLRALCAGPRTREPRAPVEKTFPHLARGQLALDERLSGRLTGFDGWAPEAGTALDPAAAAGRVMSASAFETLGRCPLAFFYRYALEVAPPEEYSLDLSLWLPPLEAGNLLHGVFREFVADLLEKGDLPRDTPEQRLLLAGILNRRVERCKLDFPPASEAAFRRRLRELQRTAAVFLAEEAVHCRTSTPLHLEWSIGMGPEGEGEAAEAEAGRIALAGGRRVRVRGRIDRVDRTVRGTYAIWDYKTGGAGKYSYHNPFRQGRVVQPALYLALAAGPLREKYGDSARLESFGFFFPGPREQGRRLQWRPDELEEGGTVLSLLCGVIASGAFIATDKDDRDVPPDCRSCDYQAACHDLHATVTASADKLANPENRVLEPFRQLRGMPDK